MQNAELEKTIERHDRDIQNHTIVLDSHDSQLKVQAEQIERHDMDMQTHESILDSHASQLKVQAEQIKQLQDNAVKLENVVMAENRETRLTITNTNQQLHELINGLMGFKSGQSQISQNIQIARWESIAKIIGILAGSGGILWYIFGQ